MRRIQALHHRPRKPPGDDHRRPQSQTTPVSPFNEKNTLALSVPGHALASCVTVIVSWPPCGSLPLESERDTCPEVEAFHDTAPPLAVAVIVESGHLRVSQVLR